MLFPREQSSGKAATDEELPHPGNAEWAGGQEPENSQEHSSSVLSNMWLAGPEGARN